jgi:hypothetical protein
MADELDPQARFRGLPPKTMLTRRPHTHQGKRFESIGVSVVRSSADGYWAKTREGQVFHVSFTALESGWWRVGK